MTNTAKTDIIIEKGVIVVSVYNVIKEKFDYDEPIFVSDIEAVFPERSRPWIDKTIKTLLDKNQFKRFSTGVYYIPRKTLFGDSLLNPQKVVVKKYIENGSEIYGYISGTALLNILGLTTQVPNIITVVSNNESSRGRMITLGNQSVYVMKSTAKITKENCSTLQFLEVIKTIDLNSLDEIEFYNLEKYIDDNNITLEKISKYCSFFPDYVSKRVLGGCLIGKLTQQ